MPRAASRPARLIGTGAAALGIAAALASCAASPDGTASAEPDPTPEYRDGQYEASGSYVAPSGQESVDVSLTIAGDIVTAVEVTPGATDPTAHGYQERFASGIAAAAVGRDIDELDVSRVAGSSLTSGGFAEALEAIKAQAAL